MCVNLYQKLFLSKR